MPSKPVEQVYYTSKDVANLLGCSTASVARWCRQGLIKTFTTPGGHRRFEVNELVRFIQDRGMPMPDCLK